MMDLMEWLGQSAAAITAQRGLHSATRVGIVLRVLCPGSLKSGSLVCVVEFEQQNCIDIQAKIDSMSCISLTIRFKMITMSWPFG